MSKWRYDGRRRHYGWLIFLVLLVLAGSGGWFYTRQNVAKPKTQTNKKVAKTDQPTDITGKYLFSGTAYWARAVETQAHGNYAQPFSQLSTFHPEQYDGWQIDLECPVTNDVVPYADQVTLLKFNCLPQFLPYATKYFNLINLANNHTDNDNGSVGLTKTREALSKIPGVQYFGTFDPSVTKDDCEVVGLPIHIQMSNGTSKKGNLPIAFCEWHYVYRLPLPGEIETEQKFAKVMPVFGFVHMGREYIPKADPVQVSIAHQVIDNGAQFVIANQSHWVQNTEVYKNKLIVYSTGNLIFDQLDTETNRGDNIAVSLSVKDDANIEKWLKLGPTCVTFQDDCFSKAQAEGLKNFQVSLDYHVVASLGGDRVITHLADPATQTAVEQRMNWSQTCQELKAPYGCN